MLADGMNGRDVGIITGKLGAKDTYIRESTMCHSASGWVFGAGVCGSHSLVLHFILFFLGKEVFLEGLIWEVNTVFLRDL